MQKIASLERIGGHPALDFVNTVHSWENGRPGDEYLADFGALAAWHAENGLVAPPALRRFVRATARGRRRAWRAAIELRAALYRLFGAAAAGDAMRQEDLDLLQGTLQRTMCYRRMLASDGGVAVDWHFGRAPPDAILGPVAWLAADLLQRGPLDRLKACPAIDGCGWLFLDLSRNRSRTWCSMKTCGNLAKVRRFRAR